jgi:hypothetical protein
MHSRGERFCLLDQEALGDGPLLQARGDVCVPEGIRPGRRRVIFGGDAADLGNGDLSIEDRISKLID